MNPNPIRELLDQVLTTGKLPTDEQISAVVTRGDSVRERHEARHGIQIAARRIRNALDSGLPDQAAAAADDAADTWAAYTGAGATSIALPPRNQPHAPAPKAPASRHGAEQLRDLFGSRIRGGLTAADLDRLDLANGVTAEQRAEILAAGRRVAATYSAGQQGVARRLVDEYAQQYAGVVAEPDGRDPHEDIEDPRELAALVGRGVNRQR